MKQHSQRVRRITMAGGYSGVTGKLISKRTSISSLPPTQPTEYNYTPETPITFETDEPLINPPASLFNVFNDI